jgi:hypothetical protein
MKEILLNTWAICNRLGKNSYTPVFVDDEDYEELNKFHWSRAWRKDFKTYYAARTEILDIGGKKVKKRILMHRLLLGAVAGEEVDHADGCGFNNQKQNLRKCTHQQNMANRNHGSLKGVSYTKANPNNPWVVHCGHKYIGAFPTHEMARAAYNHAAIEKYGEFAKLNTDADGKIRTLPWTPPKLANRTSQRRGVRHMEDGRWVAYWRRHHLGSFKTEAEAVRRREQEEAANGAMDWTPPTPEGPPRPHLLEAL